MPSSPFPLPGRLSGRLLLLALASCLSACAHQARIPSVLPDTPRTHLQDDPTLPSQPLPAKWWQLLQDPQLDALMEQAMAGNLDLQLAASRVAASRAQAGLADAASQIQLGAQAGYNRNANSAHSPLVRLGAPTRPYDLWQVGLQSSWELDLWGYLQQQQRAAQANAQAAYFGAQATQVAVLANVAQHYLLLRHSQRAATLNSQLLQLSQQQSKLLQSRQAQGLIGAAPLERAQALTAQLQAKQQALTLQTARLCNALALLLGRNPGELDQQLGAASSLPLPPDRLAVGLPSSLAHNRPDILQAEASLHAALANVAAAEADFYPRLTLNAGLESLAFNGHDLGMWNARQFSFGPALYLPLFNGGRLQQTLALTQARQQEAAIRYRQTVLQAWHEVDDAAQALHSTRASLQQQQAALAQYQQAEQHARHAYAEGLSSRLEWLEAQAATTERQLALNDARAAVSQSMVALYRSLGGNWPEDKAEAAHD
ncbi:efflux transporter outer membrane subunit [Aquitalea magnusonii]|uniref:efflux transporter outer membrane subunit n=1 Tax=Aquitalea magnusonii TaxID=332411 RepID=UPI000B5CAABC|nr:efflux transporter outer membrane subunit [Aquitalea magnusonii]